VAGCRSPPDAGERLVADQTVLGDLGPGVGERAPPPREPAVRSLEPGGVHDRVGLVVAGQDENGTLRPSAFARVLAMFATIRYIHVRSEDRPSKRSRPFTMPSQASWTTSSATAREDTYMRAIRSIAF